MDRARKVLLITYYWPPSGGAGVQRWLKLIKYLDQQGVKCTVITVDPEKASYPVRDDSHLKDIPDTVRVFHTSTSEPFGLYKKVVRRKTIPYAGFANEDTSFPKKVIRFVRGNFFIPDARKGWNRFAYAKAAELLSTESFDAVITTSPPHSTQLIGLQLKKRFPIHWIADLRDPWTDIFYYDMMLHTAWAKRKDLKLEKSVLSGADDVLVVSKKIQSLFAAKMANASKIHVLPNGFDPADFEQAHAEKAPVFTLTYTGTLSADYPIDSLLRCLETLKAQNFTLRLCFVGTVAPDLQEQLKAYDVDFKGYLPHDESVQHLQQSDALLLIIPKVVNNEGILTGKLFEYLGAQKPILAFGPMNGDAADIIHSAKAGQLFNYADVDGPLQLLQALLQGSNPFSMDRAEINRYSRSEQARFVLQLVK